MHTPDTDGSHGGSSEREKEDVLLTLVRGTLTENEEGRVGTKGGDSDGSHNDSRVVEALECGE